MNVNPAGAVNVFLQWGHLYFWLIAQPLQNQQPHLLAAEHVGDTPGTMLCLQGSRVTARVLRSLSIRISTQ